MQALETNSRNAPMHVVVLTDPFFPRFQSQFRLFRRHTLPQVLSRVISSIADSDWHRPKPTFGDLTLFSSGLPDHGSCK